MHHQTTLSRTRLSDLFPVVLPVQVCKPVAGAAFAILLMALVNAGEDLTCLPVGP
jgi:hypothetical protein